MLVHGVAFDTTTIGNASKLLEWLQGHPLTRYHDGLYSLLGMLMIMEGKERKNAKNRKNYLIEQAKREDLATPLANYEGVIGESSEIFIEWNAFRNLWLPLLKGPLANLYRTKVIHTGENARAGDERVILETLHNREARLNASGENRAVIEEGVEIADQLATQAGLQSFAPPAYRASQLTYEQHKKLMYHQHMIDEAKKDAESKREKEKEADKQKLLAEQTHLAAIKSKDARLLEQLNAEKHRLIRAEARIEQLEKRNDDMQIKLDAKDRTLDHLRQVMLQ